MWVQPTPAEPAHTAAATNIGFQKRRRGMASLLVPILRITQTLRMAATAPVTRSTRATLINRRPRFLAPTKTSPPSGLPDSSEIFTHRLTGGLSYPGLEWIDCCGPAVVVNAG